MTRVQRTKILGTNGRTVRWVTFADAEDLVTRRKAICVLDSADNLLGIELLPNNRFERQNQLSAANWPVLHAASIETHPRFVNGGLTRTETKPRILKFLPRKYSCVFPSSRKITRSDSG